MASSSTQALRVPPGFQIIFIAISVIIISYGLLSRLSGFRTTDPIADVSVITPEKLKELGGYVNTIDVGLYINRFQTFDVVNNSFVFSGVIWFLFNPGVVSLETLEQFAFERGEIEYRSPPDTQLVDNKLMVRYNIRVKFTSPLNYADFPLDDHRMTLMLTHPFVTPNELLFRSSQREFVVKPDTTTFGWQEVNREVKTGYETAQLDPYDSRLDIEYPVVTFMVEYARYGIRYVLSIMLPLLLIFYLSLFSFSLQYNDNMNLSIGGVTATLAYRFVIESLSPSTGYFMLSDYIFFLFLIGSMLIFFFNMINIFGLELSAREKKMVIIGLHIFIAAGNIYLFLIW